MPRGRRHPRRRTRDRGGSLRDGPSTRGGVVGAAYLMSTVTFSGKLGAAGWLGVVVAGQVLASVVLDHFGLVGFAVHPATPWRLVGVGLLLAGAAIVLRT